jgi:hypothetical protein
MAYPFDPRNAHHIPKQRYRVENWRSYEERLRVRGSLTVWISDDALSAWNGAKRQGRGGQPRYSDLAILTALSIRAVFRQTMRQTEGFMGSVIRLLRIDLAVPDHATLSRRSETLDVPVLRSRKDDEPIAVQVDSTGGVGAWVKRLV